MHTRMSSDLRCLNHELLAEGTDRLEPTAINITLVFAFGLLFMVGGIVALTALFGDRHANDFLWYFEYERRVSAGGVRLIAKVIVIAAVAALLIVLVSSKA